MISQPRFKNHLDVSVVDDDKVFIGDESSHFLMEGRALNEVARTIDGELETDELRPRSIFPPSWLPSIGSSQVDMSQTDPG